MKQQFEIICTDTIRKSMMHDNEMINQFVELYLIQCPIDLQALNQSFKTNEPKKISAAAHHIKPTMEYIGAKDLKNKFQQLEYLGSIETPIEELQEKYKEIEIDFAIMLSELQSFKEELKQLEAES